MPQKSSVFGVRSDKKKKNKESTAMKHTYEYTEYVEQIKAYNALEEISFTPEDGKEYVIAKLEERTAKKRETAGIANTIIREYL